MKIFALIAMLLLARAAHAGSIYDIPLKDIDGKDVTLAEYKGKALLIVNVASKCGFTRQYSGLESLYQKYRDKGLVVLGFPCNQFGKQEPGSNEQIKEFCSTKFHVSFPLFDKIEVKGENRSPLYAWLTGADSPFPGDIKWNFNKFLIGRDGKILKRFDSKVAPESPELTAQIESALEAE